MFKGFQRARVPTGEVAINVVHGGGRVAHRMALDHADRVTRLAVLDIAPTRLMYARTTREFAKFFA